MSMYTLLVNNNHYEVDVEPDTPLLWVLRDHIKLKGTKYGCGIAMCGACTVHIDGEAARSCSLPVSSLARKRITTIEGLSPDGDHPVQQAWVEEDVAQCGYCQGGQIMSAASFLKTNPMPSVDEIRMAMSGNICRCASYNRIEKAVVLAAQKLKQQ
ncbi:(2Fe-2S)-binding protein [Saccharicrinis aurantiacus]|nr:(2Fe-2S)-binding protein [Saccharicrinis aurantiacus]